MKDAFFTIDKFHSGYIDYNNLAILFKKVGISIYEE
jgi:Ca2+-binding EF-hand superfamily protein